MGRKEWGSHFSRITPRTHELVNQDTGSLMDHRQSTMNFMILAWMQREKLVFTHPLHGCWLRWTTTINSPLHTLKMLNDGFDLHAFECKQTVRLPSLCTTTPPSFAHHSYVSHLFVYFFCKSAVKIGNVTSTALHNAPINHHSRLFQFQPEKPSIILVHNVTLRPINVLFFVRFFA